MIAPVVAQVPTPKDNLTFPCTHGVTKALGHQATCRYEVSLFDWPANKDMYWEVGQFCLRQLNPTACLGYSNPHSMAPHATPNLP